MKRKNEAMYKWFGRADRKCKDCNHFIRERYHTKILQKCEVYGLTHSEASDWAQKYNACGMFNKPYDGNPIIKLLDRSKPVTQIDGQMTIEDFL